MESEKNTEVSVILVNYRKPKLAEKCIRSILLSVPAVSCEIIVVDNHSGDNSLEYLRNQFPGIRMTDSGRNGGFAYGNNTGIRMARGKYLLLLNSDTEVREGMLDRLYAYAESHPETGILGCMALGRDGKLLPVSHTYENAVRILLQTYVKPLFAFFGFQHRPVSVPSPGSDMIPAQWITGSAMFIRRDLYFQIGGLDENFFMYMEDEDLCRRMKKAGYEVGILPIIGYVHDCGGSSAPSCFLTREYIRSRMIYFMRYDPNHFSFIRHLLYRQIGAFNPEISDTERRRMKEELDDFAETELIQAAERVKAIEP